MGVEGGGACFQLECSWQGSGTGAEEQDFKWFLDLCNIRTCDKEEAKEASLSTSLAGECVRSLSWLECRFHKAGIEVGVVGHG